jgi:hypothetical protein
MVSHLCKHHACAQHETDPPSLFTVHFSAERNVKQQDTARRTRCAFWRRHSELLSLTRQFDVFLSQHESTVDLITILLSTSTDGYVSVVVKERWHGGFNLDGNIKERS